MKNRAILLVKILLIWWLTVLKIFPVDYIMKVQKNKVFVVKTP
jgi:hypothetical protein